MSFRKLPPTILVSISVLSPLLGPSQDTNCPNSTSILEWAKSSEFIYLFGLGQCKLFRGLILLDSWTPHKNNYQYSITEKNSWKGEGKKKWKEFLVMVLVAGKKHWEKIKRNEMFSNVERNCFLQNNTCFQKENVFMKHFYHVRKNVF